MSHSCYLKFTADTNYELGLQLREVFGEKIQKMIHHAALDSNWNEKVDRVKAYLEPSMKYFPKYVEEIKGYAEAPNVDFLEFWARSLEEEIETKIAKCTTIITNNGKLISHNEDWVDYPLDFIK